MRAARQRDRRRRTPGPWPDRSRLPSHARRVCGRGEPTSRRAPRRAPAWVPAAFDAADVLAYTRAGAVTGALGPGAIAICAAGTKRVAPPPPAADARRRLDSARGSRRRRLERPRAGGQPNDEREAHPARQSASALGLALLGGAPHGAGRDQLLRLDARRPPDASRRLQRLPRLRPDEQRSGPRRHLRAPTRRVARQPLPVRGAQPPARAQADRRRGARGGWAPDDRAPRALGLAFGPVVYRMPDRVFVLRSVALEVVALLRRLRGVDAGARPSGLPVAARTQSDSHLELQLRGR